MKESSLPSYAELSRVLSKTTLKLHPSQVHGLVCGLLCGNSKVPTAWEALVTGDTKPGKILHQDLQAVYDASAKQLSDFLFELVLLLPPDSAPLSDRAEALTSWTQGFLTGLKMMQIPIVDREQGEVTEAIDDIIEIARMNYEDVSDSEEDEVSYEELVEYVRVAVILIYQNSTDDGTKKRLH